MNELLLIMRDLNRAKNRIEDLTKPMLRADGSHNKNEDYNALKKANDKIDDAYSKVLYVHKYPTRICIKV